jgi:hypothetical protein
VVGLLNVEVEGVFTSPHLPMFFTLLFFLQQQSWRSLVGIVDGVLSAFDTQFTQNVTQIADQKGCNCFAINEAHRTLVISNKKKLLQYAWQAPGFAFVRDFNLPDVPKNMLFVRNAVVLGYRKHYECLDLVTGVANRILDVEREHSMLITEVSAPSGCNYYLC